MTYVQGYRLKEELCKCELEEFSRNTIPKVKEFIEEENAR